MPAAHMSTDGCEALSAYSSSDSNGSLAKNHMENQKCSSFYFSIPKISIWAELSTSCQKPASSRGFCLRYPERNCLDTRSWFFHVLVILPFYFFLHFARNQYPRQKNESQKKRIGAATLTKSKSMFWKTTKKQNNKNLDLFRLRFHCAVVLFVHFSVFVFSGFA